MNLSFQNRRTWQRLFCLFLLCLGLTCPLSADAAERINSFRSDLVVAADGLFDVTETITVTAEGDKIKRGIYRDIPLQHRTGLPLKALPTPQRVAIAYRNRDDVRC